jgi:hypothetical protein
MQAILLRKNQLEQEGRAPRLVLLNEAAFEMLEEDWFGTLGDMPGGEDLAGDISMRRRMENRTTGDGMLFDLVVFKVETLLDKEFEVY